MDIERYDYDGVPWESCAVVANEVCQKMLAQESQEVGTKLILMRRMMMSL